MPLDPARLMPHAGTRPRVMGILNVTHDSFSDGEKYLDVDDAIRRALEMISEGADIIDVGPESTRPGSTPVAPDVQISRAIPVIEAINRHAGNVLISIDTRSAAVAQAALAAGAELVNDVSAMRDDVEMVDVVKRTGAGVVLMHMRGTPADMQAEGGPQYADVVAEVRAFLQERRKFAMAAGIAPERIVVDPGIGFGKRVEHNLLLLKHVAEFASLRSPVLLGASRKRFLGAVLGLDNPLDREAGSLACAAYGALGGVAILRVHAVAPTVQFVHTLDAIRSADSERRL